MKILFSIPVHENNEVIRNAIENINKFVKSPIVVIHINKFWDDFDFSIEKDYDNVYVNPNRVFGIKFESQMPILYSNLEYIESLGIDFDYFSIFHTNEMFIRRGIEDYIGDRDMSLQHFPNIRHQNTVNIMNEYKQFLDEVNINEIFNNHVEGNFFKKSLFKEILNYIKTNMPQLIDFKGALEETLIPTIAYKLADKNKIAFTYLRSFYHENIAITPDIIDILLTPRQLINGYYNIPIYSDWVFSVKPVNREMDDPIRKKINDLE